MLDLNQDPARIQPHAGGRPAVPPACVSWAEDGDAEVEYSEPAIPAYYELTRARGFDQLHKGRLIMDWETGQLTREIDEVRFQIDEH